MKKIKQLLPITTLLICSMLIHGCTGAASQGDFSYLYTKHRSVEKRLKKTEQDVEEIREVEIGELREKTFELENKLLEAEQIIGKLHSYLEQRLNELAEGVSVTSNEITSPQEKPVATPVPVVTPAPVEQPLTKKPSPTLRANPIPLVAEKPAQPEEPAVEDKIIPETETPKSDWDLGMDAYKDGDFELARSLFVNYMETTPQSDRVSEAKFMVASSYFEQGFYEESILGCQDMIDTWPQSPRVPLCMLNQGIALVRIGKPVEATLFFESLIEAHPESEEAIKAREQIDALSAPPE